MATDESRAFVLTGTNPSPESLSRSLGSVTGMYHRVLDGDSRAAGDLWEAYSRRLAGLARAVLRQRGIAPAKASEDSVVNFAFARFIESLSRGKYDQVADRHELWCLLAVITRNQALQQARRAGRGPGEVDDAESLLLQQANTGPTPEEVAALSEMISEVERRIRERSKSPEQADRIIRIMTMTLSGHTQKEIAEAIGQSEITIRRNVALIRDLLRKESETESET